MKRSRVVVPQPEPGRRADLGGGAVLVAVLATMLIGAEVSWKGVSVRKDTGVADVTNIAFRGVVQAGSFVGSGTGLTGIASGSAWPTGTVTWVSIGGDNVTGAVNDESKPFATLAAARLAVSNILGSAPAQGWTIAARGMRFTNEANLLLPGHVNFDFSGCDFEKEGTGSLFLMGSDNGYVGPTTWSGWIKIGSYLNTNSVWPCGVWISVSGTAAATIDIERDVLVSGDNNNAFVAFDSGVSLSIAAKTINGAVYAAGPCKIVGANLLQGVTSAPGATGLELFNCTIRRTATGLGQSVIGNYAGRVRVYNSVLVGDGCPIGMGKYSSANSTFVFVNCAMKVINGFGSDYEENENDGIICADEYGVPVVWFLGGCVSAQDVGTECTVAGGTLSVVADIPIE